MFCDDLVADDQAGDSGGGAALRSSGRLIADARGWLRMRPLSGTIARGPRICASTVGPVAIFMDEEIRR